MGGLIALLLLVWLMAVVVLVLRHRCLLASLWTEPVLRRPVLIIESDDWGAGPLAQTEALQKLSVLLSKFSDSEGRHPKVTLGMVLASADTQAIQASGLTQYQRLGLDDERYVGLRESITAGVEQKVFAIQLHGMEHYWPAALMQSASSEEAVRQWLMADEFPQTEQLPSHLQSRWVNGAVLPSTPLEADQITAAVSDEVAVYQSLFAKADRVVVPPTFVWNRLVEQAWAKKGIDVLVTPGQRYESRDAEGCIAPSTERMFNGQRSEEGLIYIVRDDYFEPSLGHTSERVVSALKAKSSAGRPTLLETHRFNFIGTEQKTAAAFHELEKLLARVSRDFPETAFISTAELARVYRDNDLLWLADSFAAKVQVLITRCRAEYGLWRSFKVTGLALLLTVVAMFLPIAQENIRGRA